jgi:hypothetical protein
MQITFTIPDAKLPRVVAAIKGLHPKPDGFTDSQWAKEYLRRLVVRDVLAWEKQVADSAITPDDGIIS